MKKLSTVILGISLLSTSTLFAQTIEKADFQSVTNVKQVNYIYPESGNNN